MCTINKSAHMKKIWKLILWSSYLQTQELKTVGVKREEVTPPETEKGLAPFDC